MTAIVSASGVTPIRSRRTRRGAGQAPVALAAAAEGAACVPHLDRDQRRAGARPGRGDEVVDHDGRQVTEHEVLAEVGQRVGRVHVHLGE